jgi:5-methylthioadenosine/S-adenosylhomocysteine deaminase
MIDATGMVVLPGIVDTHWHMWNSLLRGLVGATRETAYFPTLLKFAPHYTPQDTYFATRLALADAVNAGVVTVHNWAHNIRNPEHADRSVDAHLESGLRARFSYGSPQGLPPNEAQDMPEIARIMKNAFQLRRRQW